MAGRRALGAAISSLRRLHVAELPAGAVRLESPLVESLLRRPPGAAAAAAAPARLLWSGLRGSFSSSAEAAAPAGEGGKAGEPAAAAAAGPEPGAAEAPPAGAEGGGDEPSDPAALRAALDAARAAAAAEAARADELKDRLLRALADMENLRERTARAAAEARTYAVADFVKSLVEVADNLERAAGAVPAEAVAEPGGGGGGGAAPASPSAPSEEAPMDAARALGLLRSLREGVLLTDAVLARVLAAHGVERYGAEGEPFDPNAHMALFQVPDATRAPGTVAVVVKPGYRMGARTVRAAEVGVARAVDEE